MDELEAYLSKIENPFLSTFTPDPKVPYTGVQRGARLMAKGATLGYLGADVEPETVGELGMEFLGSVAPTVAITGGVGTGLRAVGLGAKLAKLGKTTERLATAGTAGALYGAGKEAISGGDIGDIAEAAAKESAWWLAGESAFVGLGKGIRAWRGKPPEVPGMPGTSGEPGTPGVSPLRPIQPGSGGPDDALALSKRISEQDINRPEIQLQRDEAQKTLELIKNEEILRPTLGPGTQATLETMSFDLPRPIERPTIRSWGPAEIRDTPDGIQMRRNIDVERTKPHFERNPDIESYVTEQQRIGELKETTPYTEQITLTLGEEKAYEAAKQAGMSDNEIFNAIMQRRGLLRKHDTDTGLPVYETTTPEASNAVELAAVTPREVGPPITPEQASYLELPDVRAQLAAPAVANKGATTSELLELPAIEVEKILDDKVYKMGHAVRLEPADTELMGLAAKNNVTRAELAQIQARAKTLAEQTGTDAKAYLLQLLKERCK